MTETEKKVKVNGSIDMNWTLNWYAMLLMQVHTKYHWLTISGWCLTGANTNLNISLFYAKMSKSKDL